MGTVILKVKLLPDSLETNLEEIKNAAKSILGPEGAGSISFEEMPFAFGLKALFVTFSLPEEKGADAIESLLSEIPGVSSVALEDYRRALG